MKLSWFNPLKIIAWLVDKLDQLLTPVIGKTAADAISNAIKTFLDTEVGKLTGNAVTLAEALLLGQPDQAQAKFDTALAILKQTASSAVGDAAAQLKEGNYETFVQMAWQGLDANLEAMAKKLLGEKYDEVVAWAEKLGLPVPPKPAPASNA